MKTLRRHLARAICALVMATLASHAAMANRRVALIIGNAKYEHADALANTVNDADAIAALFTRAGFDVVDERRNVGVVEFKRAVREFMLSASAADIAVVYYSGHGIEFGGVNYMIPIDARLANNFDIEDEAISLDRIITATQPARKLRLIILDACRDNPFVHTADRSRETRSVTNGLVSVAPGGTDTLIAYAAKAGSVSYDGAGPNSPFTTALVKHLTEPGLDIRIALGKVRDDVLASTADRQEPFVYGSLGGDTISLVPAPAAPKVEPAPQAADPTAAIARDYELAERVGTRNAWESFLEVHGAGFYADLARAQLSKLTVASPASANLGKEAGVAPEAPAAAQRHGDDRRATGEPAPVKSAPEAPPPRIEVATAPPTSEQACKRDEARLARLRLDPSSDQVARFSRELGCEALRPQVQRLMESLGGGPVVATQPPSPTPLAPPAAEPQAREQVCKREEARLEQLRADPKVDQVAEFARALACEDLRPQVQRLLESLGAPGQPSELAAAPASRGIAQIPEDAQACRRDAVELARLRANPDRAAAVRFMRELKCENLHPQAARLLESLGD
ncbi:MAG: caspase domain-containing protein [Roseiarcus sp.]